FVSCYLYMLSHVIKLTSHWCCDNRALVQGNSQASVSVNCPYKPQHKESQKYFCIGTRPSTCLQQATVTSKHNTGRFSLHDNNADGVFTVTITGLTQKDSGMYLCGIRVDRGLDVYSVVHLEVKGEKFFLEHFSRKICSTLSLTSVQEFLFLWMYFRRNTFLLFYQASQLRTNSYLQ
uniref:Immunoglobulin V-set domain-containing protein n=1 Tax=Oncorhynchus mykiss TaxID=8022 RepID=A0A8K9VGU5_ONCMY